MDQKKIVITEDSGKTQKNELSYKEQCYQSVGGSETLAQNSAVIPVSNW